MMEGQRHGQQAAGVLAKAEIPFVRVTGKLLVKEAAFQMVLDEGMASDSTRCYRMAWKEAGRREKRQSLGSPTVYVCVLFCWACSNEGPQMEQLIQSP